MSAEATVMANPEYEQLLENLRLLKLGGLVPVLEAHLKRAAKNSLSYQDFLAGLVREALEVRAQRTRERRLAACRFPFVRRLEEFDWAAQPTLNRAELERLGSLRFVDDHDNVAFLGPPGLGKTMLAVALGVVAVESGYTVRFARLDGVHPQRRELSAQGGEAPAANRQVESRRVYRAFYKRGVSGDPSAGFLAITNAGFRAISNRRWSWSREDLSALRPEPDPAAAAEPERVAAGGSPGSAHPRVGRQRARAEPDLRQLSGTERSAALRSQAAA